MKLMFISDIHGSELYLNEALKRFEEEQADWLIILGDILYHGPRNKLPEGYNPQAVITTLNNMNDKIIAIRGNCDGEVDQMVLDFPITADYNKLIVNNKILLLTHGHLYSSEQLEKFGASIVCYGHTHLYEIRKDNKITYFNPGSISLPKENRENTYGIIDKGSIYIKNLLTKSVILNDRL